jgi:hypothetical protein
VGALVNEPAYAALVVDFGRAQVVAAIREQLAAERKATVVSDAERLSQVERRDPSHQPRPSAIVAGRS